MGRKPSVPKLEIDKALHAFGDNVHINQKACRRLLIKAGLPPKAIAGLTIAAVADYSAFAKKYERWRNDKTLGCYIHQEKRVELNIHNILEQYYPYQDEELFSRVLLHELGHAVDSYYHRFERKKPVWIHQLMGTGLLGFWLAGTALPVFLLVQSGIIHGLLQILFTTLLAWLITMFILATPIYLLKHFGKTLAAKSELSAEAFVEQHKQHFLHLMTYGAPPQPTFYARFVPGQGLAVFAE